PTRGRPGRYPPSNDSSPERGARHGRGKCTNQFRILSSVGTLHTAADVDDVGREQRDRILDVVRPQPSGDDQPQTLSDEVPLRRDRLPRKAGARSARTGDGPAIQQYPVDVLEIALHFPAKLCGVARPDGLPHLPATLADGRRIV